MAKKKQPTDTWLRFDAMNKLNKSKPPRTLGQMFAIRKQIIDDCSAAAEHRDALLDIVYGGLKRPPDADTGPFMSHKRHRGMFYRYDERIRCIWFGWSFNTHPRKPGWVWSWSDTRYKGFDDVSFIRDALGRVPVTDLDRLIAAAEVAAMLEDNDEVLAEKVDLSILRCNALWSRLRVVEEFIATSINKLLYDRENWASGCSEAWRRISFEDGTIVTVTDRGEVIFGDAMLNVAMSMSDNVIRKDGGYPNRLAERQRHAKEMWE